MSINSVNYAIFSVGITVKKDQTVKYFIILICFSFSAFSI